MTKDRTYCRSCGYDLIGVGDPVMFTSKTGTPMVKIPFWCYECGNEWEEVFSMAEYGFLKAKGEV